MAEPFSSSTVPASEHAKPPTDVSWSLMQSDADGEEQGARSPEQAAGATVKWGEAVEYDDNFDASPVVAAASSGGEDEAQRDDDDGHHGASELPSVWAEADDRDVSLISLRSDDEDAEAEANGDAGADAGADQSDNECVDSVAPPNGAPLTTADLQATPAGPASRGASNHRTESPPPPPRNQVNDVLAREYSSATAALAARTAALSAQLAASQRALREMEHRAAPDQSWPQQRADSLSPARPAAATTAPTTAVTTPLSSRSAASAVSALSALSVATHAAHPASSSLYSPHTQPRTAHVFLPPPPGVQPSSSPHAAALPSGLQLAAAAAAAMAAAVSTPSIAAAPSSAASLPHSSHPYSSPPPASSGASAASAAAWPSSSFDPTAYAAASAHVYGEWRPAPSPSPSSLPSPPVHPSADMRFFRAAHLARAAGVPLGHSGEPMQPTAAPHVDDSFQRHLGLTLERHRAQEYARSTQSAHAPPSQGQSHLPEVEVENTLQAQLRSLAASPELHVRGRSHAHAHARTRPSSSPSPSPVRLASSFSAAAAATATAATPHDAAPASSSRFSLSQLHASPDAPTRVPPSSSPLHSPPASSLAMPMPLSSPSSSPFHSTGTGVAGGINTLQHTLHALNTNLHAFQSSMQSKQQAAERARAAALDRLEADAGALDEALQLEVRNCKLATTSMQKSVESGIDRWDAAHFDPWCAQLTELEESVAACAARLDEMERAQSESATSLPRQLDQLASQVSAALAEQRDVFDKQIRAPSAAFEQQLLLKVDRVAQQLQNLHARSHQQMNERHQQLFEGVRALKQLRLNLGSSLEGWIVGEVASVRGALRDASQSRIDSDEQLLQAFRFATHKLQRGLQLLRQ